MKLLSGLTGSSKYHYDLLAHVLFSLDAPKVTMPEKTPGYYLQPGQISCSVESLLPFTLSFVRNGVTLGVDQYLKCVLFQLVIIYSTKHLNANRYLFTCASSLDFLIYLPHRPRI